MYTVSILTLDLLKLSFNGFRLISLIVHTTSLYRINVLLLLLHTPVFLRVQFLALFFSPCILNLCQPLLTRTLSCTNHLLMTYNNRCLTSTAIATLVSAFVLSRNYYCNSLLFGSTHDVASHMQRIQNYAARVILRLPKSSSITTHLKSLH